MYLKLFKVKNKNYYLSRKSIFSKDLNILNDKNESIAIIKNGKIYFDHKISNDLQLRIYGRLLLFQLELLPFI